MKDPTPKDTLPAFFHVLGIGASTGGLYALECFLTALLEEFCFTLVFMQHLSTRLKSMRTSVPHTGRPHIEMIGIYKRLNSRHH